MGLMVALAFVVVGASSFIDSASAAKPPGVPPSTGEQVRTCVQTSIDTDFSFIYPSDCNHPSRP